LTIDSKVLLHGWMPWYLRYLDREGLFKGN
jgi:hypothetical protein